jgi:hypothetical protein
MKRHINDLLAGAVLAGFSALGWAVRSASRIADRLEQDRSAALDHTRIT